jgi:hypothetical protein
VPYAVSFWLERPTDVLTLAVGWTTLAFVS